MSGARGPKPLQGIGDVKGFSPVETPEFPVEPAPLFKSIGETAIAVALAIPRAIVDAVRSSNSERSFPRGLVKPGFSSTHERFFEPADE